MNLEDHEMMVRKQLAQMMERHRREIAPLVDELVRLEVMKPPRPIFITIEQATALGLSVKPAP